MSLFGVRPLTSNVASDPFRWTDSRIAAFRACFEARATDPMPRYTLGGVITHRVDRIHSWDDEREVKYYGTVHAAWERRLGEVTPDLPFQLEVQSTSNPYGKRHSSDIGSFAAVGPCYIWHGGASDADGFQFVLYLDPVGFDMFSTSIAEHRGDGAPLLEIGLRPTVAIKAAGDPNRFDIFAYWLHTVPLSYGDIHAHPYGRSATK